MRTTRLATPSCLLSLGASIIMVFSASHASAAELASATISETSLSPGTNQYSLSLKDTGTTTLGTFWFAWIPGDNFMPISPTGITSPAGWIDTVTSGGPSKGFAIQWKASSPSNDLTAGAALTKFSFDSGLTLAQLQSPSIGHPSDAVLTSVVYSGVPFSDAGVQIDPTAAPEPAEIGLAALGFLFIGVAARRRQKVRS